MRNGVAHLGTGLAAEEEAGDGDQAVNDDGDVQFNETSHAPKLGAVRAR
jgi:hypothetical protein